MDFDEAEVLEAARKAGWTFGSTTVGGVKCWQFRRAAARDDGRHPAFPERAHAINHMGDVLRREHAFVPKEE